VIDPRNLEKLDLIWIVVKQAKNPVVAKKAIDFLIKVYTSLDEALYEKRGDIAQLLIDECMKCLSNKDVSTIEVHRITDILRSVIEVSEKKGTGDVQPHSAILKGESFDRIIIKNATRQYYPNLIVRVLTSATVWEFVDKVSRMCDLAPPYVDIRMSGGTKIKNTDYGKTLGELGIKNHDIITVKKNNEDTD
jgi:hypothetical protein